MLEGDRQRRRVGGAVGVRFEVQVRRRAEARVAALAQRLPARDALADGVDLRAPAFDLMFALASEAMGRDLPLLRFDVDSGTNWNGPPLGASLLPPEMQPFSASPRVLLAAPPTRGVWKAGAMVWAVVPTFSLAGWICNASGSPGSWEAFGFSRA